MITILKGSNNQVLLNGCSLCTQVPDDHSGYPLSMFCVPHHYLEDLDSILLPRGLIDDRYVRIKCCV